MDDPAIKFQVADYKLREREVAIKEGELELKKGELLLKGKQAHVSGLMEHARMSHELANGADEKAAADGEQETTDADESAESDKLNEIISGQQQILAAITQTLSSMQKVLEASLVESMTPKTLRVQKMADGSFVGVREDVPQPAEMN
jgi:hypothetical protein